MRCAILASLLNRRTQYVWPDFDGFTSIKNRNILRVGKPDSIRVKLLILYIPALPDF